MNVATLLIGVEGAKTPAGGRQGAKPEEAHGPPVGKRSAWNGNQPFYMLYCLNIKSMVKNHHAFWVLVLNWD
jgi:hypothetical protein